MAAELAFARFAESLATAFQELADELRATAKDEGALTEEPLGDVAERRVLGPRQQAILDLPGLLDPKGLKTSEIAQQIRYEVPNTYNTLRGMEYSGLVEMVPGSNPQRWRRAARFRATAEPYMRAARLVSEGEWATYGDLSIAVRGDINAARAIGQAAANLPDFPNAHRILRGDGTIPEGWRSGDGKGPEECLRRLVEEGVFFTDGKADPARRIPFEELKRRILETDAH